MSTAFFHLITRPETIRLGWALVHFLWQGAVILALLELALIVVGRRNAAVRYIACAIAMALMPLCLAATFLALGDSPRATAAPILLVNEKTPEPVRTIHVPPAAPTQTPHDVLTNTSSTARPANLDGYMPAIVVVWLLGVILLGGRKAGGFYVVWRLRRVGLVAPTEAIMETFRRICHRLGVDPDRVRLQISQLVTVPVTMGWLKPIVLLPASLLSGLTPEEIEMLLAHELAHIRRHDYLINLGQTVVETVLFYHPATWWISRRMRQERENACDDLIATSPGRTVAYAKVLVRLETCRSSASWLVIGAHGGKLLGRIQRLAGARSPRQSSGFPALILTFGLVIILAVGSHKIPPMSENEAKNRGIAAMVNGVPIHWTDLVDDSFTFEEERLRAKYSGETLKRQLAEERYVHRDQQIDRELMIQRAQADGYHVPQSVLDERLDFAVKGFHGDKAAFVENLRKNGLTLGQFNQHNRDDDIWAHELEEHVYQPWGKFVHERIGFIVQGHSPRQQNEIVQAERMRIENAWEQGQRDHADIQLFDDPEYPGAKPPDFISNSSTQPDSACSTTNPVLSKALIAAAKKGDVDEASRLIQKGADPNAHGPGYDENALFVAAKYNRLDMVQLLLQHGANPNCPNDCGNQPLDWVLRLGLTDMARVLHDAGAKISPAAWAAATDDLRTLQELAKSGVLHRGATNGAMKYAVSMGHLDAVHFLEGIEGKPVAGRFLSDAASSGNIPMMQYILDQGAHMKTDGGDAMDQAVIFFNQPAAVKFLLAHGADPNRISKWNEPLISECQDATMMKVLLDAGANPNVEDMFGTPLALAPDVESVRLLVQHGANLQARSKNGRTVIECAISRGLVDDPEVIEELIKQGAEFDPHGQSGAAALCDAASFNDVGIMKLLLDRGVSPNAYGEAPYMKKSALGMAAWRNNVEAVKLLLDRGANSEGDLREATTPLAGAVMFNAPKVVALLRAAGARDVGHLSLVAAGGDVAGVSGLLAQGANVNETDRQGDTPLYYAVHNGHVDVAELLLRHGANPSLFDSNGMTPKASLDFMTAITSPDEFKMEWGVSDAEGKRMVAAFSKLFATYPVNSNYRDSRGHTALQQAILSGNICLEVLDKGHPLDANTPDKDGKPPLLLAALSPHAEETQTAISTYENYKTPKQKLKAWNAEAYIADQLIKAGANLNFVMPNGKTVGELATEAARKANNAQLLAVITAAQTKTR